MSAASILSSQTTPVRQSLSNSLYGGRLAAMKMATGENYQHFYESPTSNAIGLNMRADLDILKVVSKGIEQSQSMLYIAEDGAKAIYNTVKQMNEVLAQAKLGYMTDELVSKTLSPTYIQLKQEINRIADSIDFNGQKLLDGSGGKKTDAIQSTVSSANYSSSNPSVSFDLSGTFTLTGLQAKVGTTDNSAITIGKNTSTSVTTTGGTLSMNGGVAKIDNATITFKGVDISSGTDTWTGDITLSNMDITFNATSTFDPVTGTLTDSSAVSTIDKSATSTVSFTNIVKTGGTNSFADASNAFTASPNFDLGKAAVGDVSRSYALTGGETAKSTFTFVTGNDLNNAIVGVSLPNLRLTAKDGIAGIIETLNTSENTLSTVPTDLTKLETMADADIDIPLVQALSDQIITHLDNIGAYQTRLMNIQKQLQTSIEQVDNAQGTIMNADLAEQTENFTKENVKTNIAVSVLKSMINSYNTLAQLVPSA